MLKQDESCPFMNCMNDLWPNVYVNVCVPFFGEDGLFF